MKRLTATFVLLTSVCFAGTAAGEALEGKRSSAEIVETAAASDWRAFDPENMLYIELERGRVVVALSEHLAQGHVEQTKTLAREGFYDGLSFYRVIEGFVAQGGDVFEKRDTGKAKKALPAEFEEPLGKDLPVTYLSDEDGYASKVGFLGGLPVGVDKKDKAIWHLHCTGAFAFGRTNEKDSASTEFYITLQPQRYLDRNLTVFGRVVQGMDHVQALQRVAPAAEEGDDLGETIKTIRVAADVPEEERLNLEYLRDDTETFAAYAEARRNRPEEFFYYRPDHLDVCALAIPVRETPALEAADEADSE